MPKPVYRKGKHKKAVKRPKKRRAKFACIACQDTGVNSRGGTCIACMNKPKKK